MEKDQQQPDEQVPDRLDTATHDVPDEATDAAPDYSVDESDDDEAVTE